MRVMLSNSGNVHPDILQIVMISVFFLVSIDTRYKYSKSLNNLRMVIGHAALNLPFLCFEGRCPNDKTQLPRWPKTIVQEKLFEWIKDKLLIRTNSTCDPVQNKIKWYFVSQVAMYFCFNNVDNKIQLKCKIRRCFVSGGSFNNVGVGGRQRALA